MAKPTARSIQEARVRTLAPPADFIPAEVQLPGLAVDVLNGGMNLRASREQIQKNEGRLVLNSRVRDYWTGRRPGTGEWLTKPDSVAVTGLATFYRDDGRIYLIRVTPYTVKVAQLPGGSWRTYSLGSGLLALGAGVAVRPVFAHFLGQLYMANGVDRIMHINIELERVDVLSEAPRARFLTSFGDRLMAAYVGFDEDGLYAIGVAWSAFSEARIWKQAPQPTDTPYEDALRTTAGAEVLMQSPTDAGDEISNIFGLENVGVVIRERSIWHIDRQQSALAPFRFMPVVSNVGSDLPYSAARGPAGSLIFADSRTQSVYLYAPGSAPRRFSDKVDAPHLQVLPNLWQTLSDPYWVQGTWDPFFEEYHLILNHPDVIDDGTGNPPPTPDVSDDEDPPSSIPTQPCGSGSNPACPFTNSTDKCAIQICITISSCAPESEAPAPYTETLDPPTNLRTNNPAVEGVNTLTWTNGETGAGVTTEFEIFENGVYPTGSTGLPWSLASGVDFQIVSFLQRGHTYTARVRHKKNGLASTYATLTFLNPSVAQPNIPGTPVLSSSNATSQMGFTTVYARVLTWTPTPGVGIQVEIWRRRATRDALGNPITVGGVTQYGSWEQLYRVTGTTTRITGPQYVMSSASGPDKYRVRFYDTATGKTGEFSNEV